MEKHEVFWFLWRYLTFPLWFLQPSYPDPDAWVVLALYETLWIVLHILFIIGILYAVAKKSE